MTNPPGPTHPASAGPGASSPPPTRADWRTIPIDKIAELVEMAAGPLILVLSFFAFYTLDLSNDIPLTNVQRATGATVSSVTYSGSLSGWSSGAVPILAILAAVLASAFAIVVRFGKVTLPFKPASAVLAGYGVSAFFLLIVAASDPDTSVQRDLAIDVARSVGGNAFGYSSTVDLSQYGIADFGHGFAVWLSLFLALLAIAVGAYLLAKTSGNGAGAASPYAPPGGMPAPPASTPSQ